ncbi:hypothetical protein N7490_004102 [Penicillium lividum]|nr:hypothetical protein N7490_004102 [Penicillium lividum]
MAHTLRSISSETTADSNLVPPSANEASDDVPLLSITTRQFSVQGPNFTPENRETFPSSENVTADSKSDAFPQEHTQQFDWAGSWTWEIVSVVFSIVCVALLAAFLGQVNGVEYSSWQYRLSPNTVASLIATIAKSALLISVSSCLSQLKWNQAQLARPTPLYNIQVLDQASRGPWGALEVLWRRKMKPELATAGALLMVLSLAMDPLAQQLLAYPIIRIKASNESAYVQTTHGYNTPILETTSNLFNDLTYMSIYDDPNMLKAILSGLSQTSSPLEPICSTGDCDYPNFVSLGICSKCEDVTTKTTQVCEMTSTMPGSKTPLSFEKPLPLDCTYTLPSGYKIRPQVFLESQSQGEPGTTFSREPWTSISTSDAYAPPMVSFISARYDQSLVYTLQNASTWERKPILTECAINWCEKEYTNNYLSNDHRGLSVAKSQILTLNDETGYLAPLNGSSTLSQNSSYTVDVDTMLSLPSILGDIFNGTLNTNFTLTASPALFCYISQNLTETIAQMTTAMTDVLRSTAGPDTSRIHGTAYAERAIIHVRWAWIAVPVASVVMAVFILLATATSSRKLNTILWKSSVLPLVLTQLQTRPEHDLVSFPPHVGQITDMSKEIWIVVEKSHPPVMVEA